VPDRPLPGRSLVTRRAIVDIVRSAVMTSYGVIGVDAGAFERVLGRLGVREPGIRVRLDRGLEIDLYLVVRYGLPIAEVARQVDSAVRYAVRRSLGHDVRRLTVHVDGLRYQPASVPPTKQVPHEAPSAEVLTGEVEPSAAARSEAVKATAATDAIEASARSGRHDGRGKSRAPRRRGKAGRPGDD
jgi:uncharacterized alkaline shock family protein YloU